MCHNRQQMDYMGDAKPIQLQFVIKRKSAISNGNYTLLSDDNLKELECTDHPFLLTLQPPTPTHTHTHTPPPLTHHTPHTYTQALRKA